MVIVILNDKNSDLGILRLLQNKFESISYEILFGYGLYAFFLLPYNMSKVSGLFVGCTSLQACLAALGLITCVCAAAVTQRHL